MEELIAKGYNLIAVFGLRIVTAAAILVIGRWVAKFLNNLILHGMRRAKVDPTLVSFVGHLVYVVLLAFVCIAALNQLGIQTASFVAIIGAAGLAVGLALQGSLANFAAGVLLIMFRPFKVEDFIEGGGVAGTVEEIQIFTTRLKTPDNKTIIVPNAKLTADNITNFSAKDNRRLDLVFGVSYADDLDRVRRVLLEVAEADARILKDPPPMIAVKELADSSVNFLLRVWTRREVFWDVNFATVEAVKRRFDQEGITIPFPQRDVHVYAHPSGEAVPDATPAQDAP